MKKFIDLLSYVGKRAVDVNRDKSNLDNVVIDSMENNYYALSRISSINQKQYIKIIENFINHNYLNGDYLLFLNWLNDEQFVRKNWEKINNIIIKYPDAWIKLVESKEKFEKEFINQDINKTFDGISGNKSIGERIINTIQNLILIEANDNNKAFDKLARITGSLSSYEFDNRIILKFFEKNDKRLNERAQEELKKLVRNEKLREQQKNYI